MLGRVHLEEDEDGTLPLVSAWKLEAFKVEKLLLVGITESQLLKAAAGSGEWKCRQPALEAAAGSTGKNLKTIAWCARRKDAKPTPTL
ncbi:hypothetical protein SLEP1_g24550 [Rubroshorea leprosula]|uniref:Uncharacterized protein n=1 Tax=Rubroshorea leprosula TaxID=152421 RepID=A0AAV5JG05_9ROSI|nr:hypothetical protein SLEP1_g24550 [Rubroshorea leprosula]